MKQTARRAAEEVKEAAPVQLDGVAEDPPAPGQPCARRSSGASSKAPSNGSSWRRSPAVAVPARYQTQGIVTRDLRGPNPYVSVEIRQQSFETGEAVTHSFVTGLRQGTPSVASFVRRVPADPRHRWIYRETTLLGPP